MWDIIWIETMANKCLSYQKLLIQFGQKTYHFDVRAPFQLVFLPNTCEAYNRNIYIPAKVQLTNSNPMLTLHKWFYRFQLKLYEYYLLIIMQSWNVTKLTPEQLKWPVHKLLNYTVVN